MGESIRSIGFVLSSVVLTGSIRPAKHPSGATRPKLNESSLIIIEIFTDREAKVILLMSVCLSTGGGVSQHALD